MRLCEQICDEQVWFLSTKSIPYVAHLFEGYLAFAAVKNFAQMNCKSRSLPNCWDIAFIKSQQAKGTGRNWFLCNTAGMLKERTGHPTPRSLALMKYILHNHTWRSVCDPFMGSGTTAVAALKLGRSFTGIEIDPAYFEIAVKRIESAARNRGFGLR